MTLNPTLETSISIAVRQLNPLYSVRRREERKERTRESFIKATDNYREVGRDFNERTKRIKKRKKHIK